jgi:hypothetical protein
LYPQARGRAITKSFARLILREKPVSPAASFIDHGIETRRDFLVRELIAPIYFQKRSAATTRKRPRFPALFAIALREKNSAAR